MEEKNELLKKLGFSDSFIKIVNDETYEEVSFTSFSESTAFVESFDITPNDTNKVIIYKTNKPQSIVINSI